MTFRIPGWLAYFGKYYVETGKLLEAINKSYEEMGSLVREELGKLKRIKKRILRYCSKYVSEKRNPYTFRTF
ncbi:hypothetical protein YN1HA_27750 [Sulfurisphaera ohwakuensis]